MDRINRSILTAIALIGLSGLGAVEPATQPAVLPTTKPTVSAPAIELPQTNRQDRYTRRSRGNRGNTAPSYAANDPYAILRTRSIFVKGNQTIVPDTASNPSFRPGGLNGIESSKLVFNGVIIFGDEPNAMIENTGSGEVSLVREGDLIAAGKVSAISFDDMTYEANGQQRHVSLGQNMDGVIPSASASVPSTMPSGTPDGSAPTVSAPPAAGSGGSSPEDILARMKAKRNQEMGIK